MVSLEALAQQLDRHTRRRLAAEFAREQKLEHEALRRFDNFMEKAAAAFLPSAGWGQ